MNVVAFKKTIFCFLICDKIVDVCKILETILMYFRNLKMSEVENLPPMTTTSSTKQGLTKGSTKPKLGADRKKLQTLQPSGKNQKLLVCFYRNYVSLLFSHRI